MYSHTKKAVLAAAATLAFAASAGAQEKVTFGLAQTAISPIIINYIVPSYLGYYEEEGLEVEIAPVGNNGAILAGLDRGQLDFGVGVPSFQLPLVAKGEPLNVVNFFEYTYPFKWAVAVKPGSDIKDLKDLKGRTIGVSGFGITDYPVGQALIRLVGLDPEKDVEWLAVGQGLTGGQAVTNDTVAALISFDTAFGAMEAAGIELDYLPIPDDAPMVGGLYISATADFLAKNRDKAVGFARAVAKGELFVQNNPEAAARIFLELYPEAAPRGASVEDQIKALVVPIRKRMPLFSHYDETISDFGRISPEEWEAEIGFLGLDGKIKDVTALYTNDLIDEINEFDRQAVIDAAKNFKIEAKN